MRLRPDPDPLQMHSNLMLNRPRTFSALDPAAEQTPPKLADQCEQPHDELNKPFCTYEIYNTICFAIISKKLKQKKTDFILINKKSNYKHEQIQN